MPPSSKLVITCPECAAPNAATRSTCVQCGASLTRSSPTTAPPPDSSVNGTSLAGSQSPQSPSINPDQARFKAQVESNSTETNNKDGGSGAKLMGFVSQGIFYLICVVIIGFIIFMTGSNTLRAFFERLF